MKWDSSNLVESVVWQMREADLPRSENRTIIQQLFNGDPPFDPSKAEENNVEINRNDLEGVNLLSAAREQWNNAMLPPGNFVSITLDSGPVIKRSGWSAVITEEYNKMLKVSKSYMEMQRACGGNALLHGPGPCNWKDRRSLVPNPIPVASLLIPSETDLDFENCEYFAVFREWTPSQLYELTHGPKVDPGWDTGLVKAQLAYVANKLQKEPNATAYQYMPERIEELIKQDLGFWGSDAVPTIDVWDFYFREQENGKGWHRRVILDWGLDAQALNSYKNRKQPPQAEGKDNSKFLYSSGKRKYANSMEEIIHCQFADCSCFFPAKYHSQRSLGWMLWGVCDLQNRLHCKFNEQVFLQLMWFFRVASDAEMRRLKSANFMHFGVIPPGVNFLKSEDRFKPDMALIEMCFARNKALMDQSAASHNPDWQKGDSGPEKTALEVMAKINAVNARVGGMLNLAYTYEEFKDREICRRACIPHTKDAMAQAFQRGCLKKGVPEAMLDAERWIVQRERVLGSGNQTMQMAIVQGIQTIRKNLGPDGQREADHLFVLALSGRADLAERLAPIKPITTVSNSMHDAQLAIDRLMRGLPLTPTPNMVYEDYVKVWIADLGLMVQEIEQTTNMATMEQLKGFGNMIKTISQFMQMMGGDDDERMMDYKRQLAGDVNKIKGFAQRLQQQMKAQQDGQGQGGIDPKTLAEIQGKMLIDKAKASNLVQSHAVRTAQKQTAFELGEQRKDRELNAEIRRKNLEAHHERIQNALTAFQE